MTTSPSNNHSVTASLQKMTTKEYLEIRPGERHVDCWLQTQLEEDGQGSISKWSVAYDTLGVSDTASVKSSNKFIVSITAEQLL